MKRYYIETEYSEAAQRNMTTVYQYEANEREQRISRPKPLETFTHEWRAIRYIDELKKRDMKKG